MSLSTIQFAPSKNLSKASMPKHIYLLARSLIKKYLEAFQDTVLPSI